MKPLCSPEVYGLVISVVCMVGALLLGLAAYLDDRLQQRRDADALLDRNTDADEHLARNYDA